MGGIFISYRRDDAAGWAGRLATDLAAGFRGANIFMDIDAIPPGVNFDEYIAQAVGSCDILIALIGPRWLTVTDKAGKRRLDDADDFTRMEIVTALKRNVRVIPALVGGAQVPSAAELPDDLKPLARRQAFQLADHRWSDDCKKLIAALRPIIQTQNRTAYKVALGVAFVLLLGIAVYGAKLWYDVRQADKARIAEEAWKADEARVLEERRKQEEARAKERITEQERQEREAQNKAAQEKAADKPRMTETRNKAQAAYSAALGWQRRAEQYARAVSGYAQEAQETARIPRGSIPTPLNPDVASALEAVRRYATAANEASRRAEIQAKVAQEAADSARSAANTTAKATDPAAAAIAIGAAVAAESQAKSAASNAMKEADAGKQAAAAANRARDHALAVAKQTPRSAERTGSRAAQTNPRGAETQETAAYYALNERLAAARAVVRKGGPLPASKIFVEALRGSTYYTIVARDSCDSQEIEQAISSVPLGELVVLPVAHCYRIAWGLYATESEANAARPLMASRFKQLNAPYLGRVEQVTATLP